VGRGEGLAFLAGVHGSGGTAGAEEGHSPLGCSEFALFNNGSFVRKPACHRGWDWGLAQLTTGLCGKTALIGSDGDMERQAVGIVRRGLLQGRGPEMILARRNRTHR